MNLKVLIVLIFSLYFVYGQKIDKASAFFMSKEYDSAIAEAKRSINENPDNVNALVIAGRSLTALNRYTEAASYLEKSKSISGAPAYVRAWALCDLSKCYYSIGEYEKSEESLTECIQLNATKNVNSTAKRLLIRLGFDPLYNSWGRRETAHFIFHFQDSLNANSGQADLFIQTKENAFDTINSFFQATLPKKIDYFVWIDSLKAEKLFHHELAFSDPDLCITHTGSGHTIGHEMTHSIIYHAVNMTNRNKFISEGVCVYFDMKRRDYLSKIKSSKDSTVSIIGIWQNDSLAAENVIYPLGGELVKRLITNFGREKFMSLLQDQSYESAIKIYGAELENVIKSIETDLKN